MLKAELAEIHFSLRIVQSSANAPDRAPLHLEGVRKPKKIDFFPDSALAFFIFRGILNVTTIKKRFHCEGIMNIGIDYSRIRPDRKSAEPLHVQLHQALVREIRSLDPNLHVSLMSERELAVRLNLSRRTTHRAYEQLLAEQLVRKMPDKSLTVRQDARRRIAGTYRVIGVLMPSGFTRFVENNNQNALPYLEGILERCSDLNISCIMLRVPDPTASPKEIEAFAAEHFNRLCGVIHLGSLNNSASSGDPVLEQLLKHTEIPQVCISGMVPGNFGSVYADPAQGLDELCRTLKKRGFRSAGVIGRNFAARLFHYIAERRSQAMQDALVRNGLECAFQVRAGDDSDSVARILDRSDMPEVLLCHDDRIAGQVVQQAMERGIKLPGDLFLAGYDTRSNDPFLASVLTRPNDIAAAAVDMVMDHFENGVSENNRVRILPTRFVDGESLGGAIRVRYER